MCLPAAGCLSVCSESPAVRSSVPLPVVLCEKSRSCFPLQPPSLVLQRLSHPRGGGSFGSFQWSCRSILQRGGVSGKDCAGVGGQSWSRLASLAQVCRQVGEAIVPVVVEDFSLSPLAPRSGLCFVKNTLVTRQQIQLQS